MTLKSVVKIRFNTNYKEGDAHLKEWRVLVNGVEKLCNLVTINCSSYTSKDYIEGIGDKWHISCHPQRIEYIKDEKISEDNIYKEIILT